MLSSLLSSSSREPEGAPHRRRWRRAAVHVAGHGHGGPQEGRAAGAGHGQQPLPSVVEDRDGGDGAEVDALPEGLEGVGRRASPEGAALRAEEQAAVVGARHLRRQAHGLEARGVDVAGEGGHRLRVAIAGRRPLDGPRGAQPVGHVVDEEHTLHDVVDDAAAAGIEPGDAACAIHQVQAGPVHRDDDVAVDGEEGLGGNGPARDRHHAATIERHDAQGAVAVTQDDPVGPEAGGDGGDVDAGALLHLGQHRAHAGLRADATGDEGDAAIAGGEHVAVGEPGQR